MRRFFQQARQLNFKYIIGELLLIVFGILIALYINNLNEERKVINFQEKIIEEIKNSLSNDHEFHIASRIERGNQIHSSAEILLKFIDGTIEYHDSLETHFWRMNWIMIFEPQTIPFERLKSKGIEVLSNESIRMSLLELYDFTYPRISYFTEDFNTWSTNRVEPFSLENFSFHSLPKGKGYKPIDIKDIRNNNIYRNLVIEKKSRIRNLINRLEVAQAKTIDLIKQLP